MHDVYYRTMKTDGVSPQFLSQLISAILAGVIQYHTIVKNSIFVLFILSSFYSVAQKTTLDAKALYGSSSSTAPLFRKELTLNSDGFDSGTPSIGVVRFTTFVDKMGDLGEIEVEKLGRV